ncbi:basic salivary proline-rich protein 2-like [Salvia divinorum]|uniref:Basic salivary proline-rich protein 2-like n=1 Tax=Salvia divinorum TaxID=28513 RepID=A0ABD1HHI9_SALDI
MDPALDPPPPVAAPLAAAIPVAPVLVAHNHPPFAEMISAAITALNERDGSSKRAIAKYIETHYSDLPPTHSALLTHHLKRLKASGHLLMVKHSYTLPGLRSAPPPAAFNGPATVESADPPSSVAKRRPGRPPKPKPDAVHVAVPVFHPPLNINDAPVFTSDLPGNAAVPSESAYIAAAVPVNGTTPMGTPVRGRGRPPKSAKRGPGRPPKGGGGGSGGRGRGRPKKSAALAAPTGQVKGAGRPRGRPPKPINVVEGFAPPVSGGHVAAAAPVSAAPAVDAPVTGKRRGRPPKPGNEAKKARNMNAALPKRQRNLSGKPLGRPRKVADAALNRTPDSHLLVAYLDLKAKLENLQSMVKQAATLIRPSLTSEVAVNAIEELELMALNVSAPPNAQIQQQPLPLPEQVQPQS